LPSCSKKVVQLRLISYSRIRTFHLFGHLKKDFFSLAPSCLDNRGSTVLPVVLYNASYTSVHSLPIIIRLQYRVGYPNFRHPTESVI